MGVPASIVVTQCVGPAPIVLLSEAEVGVVAPRPIVLYGALMVFYGSPRVLPWDEVETQRRITRISPPLFPFSQLRSVLTRFGQIFKDLFEVLTKKRPKKDSVFQKLIVEYLGDGRGGW